jgi:hypothetical protein
MNTTLTLSEHVGKRAACQALGVARASLYRYTQPAGSTNPLATALTASGFER